MLTRSVSRIVERRALSTVAPRAFFQKPDATSTYDDDGAIEYGGRNSDAGLTVAVFGANGFLGRYVCSELGQVGTKTYMPNRGCELEMRHLKPFFDLGRAWYPEYSPRDKESIYQAIGDADVVVNLVGKYYETKTIKQTSSFPYVSYETNYSFEECHVDVPRLIAQCAADLDVKSFVHVSSVAAHEDAESDWANSKWKGEQAVKEAFPFPVIVRSSQLFGPEDRLLRWFAFAARTMAFIPLIDGGETALIKPVYMGDVADAIFKIVNKHEKYKGCTFELEGAEDFTYKELAEFVYDITGQRPNMLPIPKELMLMGAKIQGILPAPAVTEDQVKLWTHDYVATMEKDETGADILGLKNLDITPTAVEKIAFSYLHQFRSGGHFIMTEGYHTDADLYRGHSKN